MKKYNILLSGPTLCNDKELKSALSKFANLYENPIHLQIGSMLKQRQCNLILFEVSKLSPQDVEVLRKTIKMYPGILVVLIVNNSDANLIARGLEYGAVDVFKRPYKYKLIAERVEALLRHSNENI